MILRNRKVKMQNQRIVWFVGSPLSEELNGLSAVARSLKNNNISVDVINFGEVEQTKTTKLEHFLTEVNHKNTR